MKDAPVDNPDLLDCRATILLTVAAAVLSVKRIQGFDLTFLQMTYQSWPGEPWRLLSSTLLHAGILHLVFNLFWTWRFGFVLEPIFGLLPMIGIVLFLAAGSSAAQWAFSGPGIGLSGVVYGLFGLLWALHRFHPNFRGVMDERTTQVFLVWFVLCIWLTVSDVMPIGNWAHGSGAVLGGLLGMSLSPMRKPMLRGLTGTVTAALLIAIAASVGRPYVNLDSAQRGWELTHDGYEALMENRDEEAVHMLESAVKRVPESPIAWQNLGVAYHRLGRMKEARAATRKSEELEARAHEKAKPAPGFSDGVDHLLGGDKREEE